MQNNPTTKKKKAVKASLEAPVRLKILVSIIERKKVDFYLSALEGYEVNMQTVLYAHGTAPTDIQHLLGLTGTDKAVILSVVREDKVKTILNAYEDKYFKTKNGKGVAFTIPMKSLIGVQLYNFSANIKGGLAK